jgi:thiol-disulfide isomerase/thioredoxin
MQFIVREEDLSFQKRLQVLYFYASWMPYHKKMMVMIGKMEEKYPDIDFFAIDVDYFKGLCKRFSVESVPMVLIMKQGTEKKRINGLVMTSAFRSAFADICNPEMEKSNGQEKDS